MLELFEPIAFFVIAGCIATYLRYQGLQDTEPNYPIHQEDGQWLDDSEG